MGRKTQPPPKSTAATNLTWEMGWGARTLGMTAAEEAPLKAAGAEDSMSNATAAGWQTVRQTTEQPPAAAAVVQLRWAGVLALTVVVGLRGGRGSAREWEIAGRTPGRRGWRPEEEAGAEGALGI